MNCSEETVGKHVSNSCTNLHSVLCLLRLPRRSTPVSLGQEAKERIKKCFQKNRREWNNEILTIHQLHRIQKYSLFSYLPSKLSLILSQAFLNLVLHPFLPSCPPPPPPPPHIIIEDRAAKEEVVFAPIPSSLPHLIKAWKNEALRPFSAHLEYCRETANLNTTLCKTSVSKHLLASFPGLPISLLFFLQT